MLMINEDNVTTARIKRTAPAVPSRGRRLYDYARAHLNLDVELRYRAVARLLRPEVKPGTRVLEPGAGAVSIGGYVGCRSTAIDTMFDTAPSEGTDRVRASVACLPFPDRSWDIVVSVDMLEHIPPALRTQALSEMIRVARRMLVLAVPVGDAAFQQDVELHEYYIAKHGEPHRFTREHVEFGLPKLAETSASLAAAAEKTGRKLRLDVRPNLNIAFRSLFMKLALHSSFVARAVYVALFPLSLLGPVLDQGTCYRTIFLARLDDTNPVDEGRCRTDEGCRA